MGNVFLKDPVYNIYWKVIFNECIFQKFQFPLLSLISVHKSYALKISVLMEPVFVTIETFDFQLMYFYVFVCVCINRENDKYANIQRSRIVPFPPFGNSSKACIHSLDWQPYDHYWQHIYLMYILLSCTSLIIKECPVSTHNLCQSNVKQSVLK